MGLISKVIARVCRLKRPRRSVLVILPALYLLLGVLAVAETFRPVAKKPGDAAPLQEKDSSRLREGTALVDMVGSFKSSGDRATYYSADGKLRLVGLENMNLERVVNTITENPDELVWSVSGTITEYHGSNYLLISRAILKSKPTAGAPRSKGGRATAGE